MKVLPLTVAVPPFVDEAAAVGGGVAGEGAAAHRRRPDVDEAAAVGLAELLVKVLPLTVAVPPLSLSRPPPTLAELLVKELPLTVAVPKLSRPPPSALAELLVKELPLTVAVPLPRCRGRRRCWRSCW